MLVLHVEVVALIAPRFVEDLLVLLLRIDVGAQIALDAALPGLRRIAIRVDEEERRAAAAGCGAAAATATTGAARATIEQLVTVGAHVVVRHARHEGASRRSRSE